MNTWKVMEDGWRKGDWHGRIKSTVFLHKDFVLTVARFFLSRCSRTCAMVGALTAKYAEIVGLHRSKRIGNPCEIEVRVQKQSQLLCFWCFLPMTKMADSSGKNFATWSPAPRWHAFWMPASRDGSQIVLQAVPMNACDQVLQTGPAADCHLLLFWFCPRTGCTCECNCRCIFWMQLECDSASSERTHSGRCG